MGRNRLTGGNGTMRPGEVITISEPEPEPVQCQKGAAITMLARAYGAELAEHVRDGSLPWGLEQFLEAMGDEIATQVKALGIPDWVPGRK